jgi:hypothetical protein
MENTNITSNDKLVCKIVLFTGKILEIEVNKSSSTFTDLKNQVFMFVEDLIDFKFIYNGKVINQEQEDAPINSIVNNNLSNVTFYTNAANVHGGCYSKGCEKDED